MKVLTIRIDKETHERVLESLARAQERAEPIPGADVRLSSHLRYLIREGLRAGEAEAREEP